MNLCPAPQRISAVFAHAAPLRPGPAAQRAKAIYGASRLEANNDDLPRVRVRELALRHGWNAMAFQTLRKGYRYFFHEDGCVTYVDTGSAWVVAGAPIAATEHLGSISAAFVAAASRARRRCCFFGTEDRFRAATAELLDSFLVGEQPVWDPVRWPETLARHASLREQLRRARAKQVRVRAVSRAELSSDVLASAARELVQAWAATRGMPLMSFVARVEPFSAAEECRYFVAEREGELIAIASVLPVPQRSGWFLEHVVRAPRAPNGTVELVVDAVLRWAAAVGSRWFTLGLAPLAGDVSPFLHLARERSASLYDFDGLRRFKAKLRPSEWLPIYVSHPRAQSTSTTLVDVLAAFTGEGFLRFGARALARDPALPLALLSGLFTPQPQQYAGAGALRANGVHSRR